MSSPAGGKKKKDKLKSVLIWLIILLLLVIVLFMWIPPFNDGSGLPNADIFGTYGDFIGGLIGTIVSIGTAILVYITFRTQKQEFFKNEIRQDLFFKSERFESRFFEMIRSNRDMVWNMEYEVPDEYTETGKIGSSNANKHNIILVRGQKVFVQIHKHIRSAFRECEWVFLKWKKLDTFFVSYEKLLEERNIFNKYYGDQVTDEIILKLQRYNLIYLCVFYGIAEGGIEMARAQLNKKYASGLVEDVIKTLQLKPTKWSKNWEEYNAIRRGGFATLEKETPGYFQTTYDKFYGGHHHRLGQYFRHLFTIYHYINEQPFMSHPEKYKYARMLRSQFSAYEQSVFFFNSLCSLGRSWEIEATKQTFNDWPLDEYRLITKYDIIKNISVEFTGGPLRLDTIYPLVEFEIETINDKKQELKKRYQ